MTAGTPRKLSPIDVLSAGFRELNRRPWLALPVFVVNMLIAYAPPVSLRPLLTAIGAFMDDQLPRGVTAGPSNLSQLLEFASVDWRQPFALTNALPLLNLSQIVQTWSRAYEVRGWDVVLALLVVNLIVFPWSVIFLAQIGRTVRGDTARAGVPHEITRVALVYGAVLAIAGAVAVVIGVPLLVAASMASLITPVLGVLLVSLILFAGFWLSIYFGFAREALAVARMGPIGALRASFGIMRQHFWASIVFLTLASFLVPAGTAAIWRLLPPSLLGLAVAVIGSSYIGTGLAIARMVFVHDRLGK